MEDIRQTHLNADKAFQKVIDSTKAHIELDEAWAKLKVMQVSRAGKTADMDTSLQIVKLRRDFEAATQRLTQLESAKSAAASRKDLDKTLARLAEVESVTTDLPQELKGALDRLGGLESEQSQTCKSLERLAQSSEQPKERSSQVDVQEGLDGVLKRLDHLESLRNDGSQGDLSRIEEQELSSSLDASGITKLRGDLDAALQRITALERSLVAPTRFSKAGSTAPSSMAAAANLLSGTGSAPWAVPALPKLGASMSS